MKARSLTGMWRKDRARDMRTHALKVEGAYTLDPLRAECAAYARDLRRAADIIEGRDDALRLLEQLVEPDGFCSFHFNRKEGETCREAMTRLQGAPHPGCPSCETRLFLKKLETP